MNRKIILIISLILLLNFTISPASADETVAELKEDISKIPKQVSPETGNFEGMDEEKETTPRISLPWIWGVLAVLFSFGFALVFYNNIKK